MFRMVQRNQLVCDSFLEGFKLVMTHNDENNWLNSENEVRNRFCNKEHSQGVKRPFHVRKYTFLVRSKLFEPT